MLFRPALVVITIMLVGGRCPAQGETVRISASTTTTVELPGAVRGALARLVAAPGDAHELLIEGTFEPTATIKFEWTQTAHLRVRAAGFAAATLQGARLPEGMETVFMAGRNISLEGIRFVNSRGHALVVGEGSNGYAVRGCTFEDCRQSAIHVYNDPHTFRPTATPRGHITDNRIHRFNLARAKWVNDGISVFDQGVVIAGNFVHDSPTETMGIRAMGRDLVIERNHVQGVSKDDSGGIYLWGGPHAALFRGNVVRWNYVVGAARGVYLDDGTSGVRVVENVIKNSTVCAVFISGGRDNVVERNVVDKSPLFVHLDSRCLGWDTAPGFAATVQQSLSALRAVLAHPQHGPLFLQRYPELQTLEDVTLVPAVYGRPEANIVRDNFARGIDNVWELMDFSVAVKTDFRALNKLEAPSSIAASENLSRIGFKQRFGFHVIDRLGEIAVDTK